MGQNRRSRDREGAGSPQERGSDFAQKGPAGRGHGAPLRRRATTDHRGQLRVGQLRVTAAGPARPVPSASAPRRRLY